MILRFLADAGAPKVVSQADGIPIQYRGGAFRLPRPHRPRVSSAARSAPGERFSSDDPYSAGGNQSADWGDRASVFVSSD